MAAKASTGIALPLLLFVLLSICNATLHAQDNTGTSKKFAELLTMYRQQQIDDTSYLKLADSLADLSYNEDSLEQWLLPYQQLAFSDNKYALYRINYYRHLRKLSDNKNRYGSAIYYSEKRNEERIRQNLVVDGEITNGDLYAMAVHVTNKDYAKVFASYNQVKPLILGMTAHIAAEDKAAHPESVSLAFAILDVAATAAWKTGNTALLDEMIVEARRMLSEINLQPVKYSEFIVYCRYISHCLDFYKAILTNDHKEVENALAICLSEVKLDAFGEINSPTEYACDKYMEAFDYYYDRRQLDSAQKYLNLVRSVVEIDKEFENERMSFWLEADSRLQASFGKYEAAYRSIRRAFDMMNKAYNTVNTDKDNNLYAMAKAENTHKELLLAVEEKNKAEKSNLILFTILGVLISGGIVAFLVYQSKQRQRLNSLQLSLARNFHDELGPMVLYANLLLKKESESNSSQRISEARAQIKQIMESIRSISKDLKTVQFKTISQFCDDIAALLQKIKSSTGIDHKTEFAGTAQILTDLQYNNLKKILSELITNSIKHSECELITVKISVTENKLKITYADDGGGLPPGFDVNQTLTSFEEEDTMDVGQDAYTSAGIGLQNIKERTELLKGVFVINNFYPDGYWVELMVPVSKEVNV
ncbi:hypothetical protein HHL16_10400 [Pseudoflavitalea sp. G-6-1-2]|uniref:sensor histidine kinase n=1 Tax=Pseudoflavitalea sp. G-6-1-2 TaxID=2728841 RepID=UPI00146F3CE5|nr:ATP-binding protein [Pseudoflavitalea sp. G-6-1-2]NML21285.1 hypothetical protein [Pseudoflavitalea sp. G-6-1-2]